MAYMEATMTRQTIGPCRRLWIMLPVVAVLAGCFGDARSQVIVENDSDAEVVFRLNSDTIGTETVKTHLRNTFAKLGLRNRVAAAAFVQRAGGLVRS